MRSPRPWLSGIYSAHDWWCVFWVCLAIVSAGIGGWLGALGAVLPLLNAIRSLKRYLFDGFHVRIHVCCCGGGGGDEEDDAETAAPIVAPMVDEVRCN